MPILDNLKYQIIQKIKKKKKEKRGKGKGKRGGNILNWKNFDHPQKCFFEPKERKRERKGEKKKRKREEKKGNF